MKTLTPRYPHARVRLVGEDGSAFAIVGRTKRALQSADASGEDVAEFMREASAGDDGELLATVTRWVDAE